MAEEPSRDSTRDPSPSSISSSATALRLGALLFAPPPEEAMPEQSLGAGSRNKDCFNASSRLPVDVDADNTDAETDRPATPLAAVYPPNQVGLTTAERPTLWLYNSIPSIRRILLSVREAASQQFHSQTSIDMPPQSAWVGLQIGEDAPPLELGIVYEWAAIAICGDRPTPNDPSFNGWVRRIPPLSPDPPPQTSPFSLAQQYAQQGLWYDLVTVMLEPEESPQDSQSMAESWADLMDYLGLDAIAPSYPPVDSSVQER